MVFINKILILIVYLLIIGIIFLFQKRFLNFNKMTHKNENDIPTMRDYYYR